jgi:lipopolysaccharide export system ATP-binding protein
LNEGAILVEGEPGKIANSELARKFYFGEDFSL